jgi:hypothetical protein
LRRLTVNLGNPYSGNDSSLQVNEHGQLIIPEGKKKKVKKVDPIKKLLDTN